MRKFYLLTTLVLGVFCKTYSQDTANFSIHINANNIVEFINASHLHEDAYRKAIWSFGDGTWLSTAPLSNTSHTYKNGTYTACLKIYKYQTNTHDSVLTSELCKTFTIGNVSSDSCSADFNVGPVSSVNSLTRSFLALPWHNHQKIVKQVCWNFGDGHDTCVTYPSTASPNNFEVHHTYAQTGNYNVCVKILYDGGCGSDKCKIVSVELPHDTCYINILEAATNVNRLEHHFYAGLAPNKVAERICWSFGDGADTCYNITAGSVQQAVSIVHRYPAPGTYHVCVRVKYSNGCEAEKCMEIVIRSTANVCGGYMLDSIGNGKAVYFKGYSVNSSNDHATTWRWTFGDGSLANDQNATHTYKEPGNYDACLYIKTDLGCETKICKQITIRGNTQPKLTLTPNPVNTILHVLFLSTFQEEVKISIYNANGLIMKTFVRAALVGNNNWDFDVSTLPVGVYTVLVSSPHQLASAIFFKE